MGRKFFWLLALPLGIFGAVLLHPGTAHAAPFARGEWQGYFNGNVVTSGHNIFTPPADTGIYDVNTFMNLYQAKLYSGVPRDVVGAGFTVLTMLGYPAGTPLAVAQDPTVFARWKSAVQWYANNGRILWQVPYSYVYNTYYYTEPTTWGDVAWYNDSNTQISIVFLNPNGTSYAIKSDCANPVGNMSQLYIPTIVSCGSLSETAPEPIAGNTSMQVTGTVNYISGPPGTPAVGATAINVSPDPGWIGSSGSLGGNTVYVTSSGSGFTPTSPGMHTVYWAVWVNDALAQCWGSYTVYPPTTINCAAPVVDPAEPEINTRITVTAQPTFTGGPPTVTYGPSSMTVSPSPGLVGVTTTPGIGYEIVKTAVPFTETNPGDFTISYTVHINEKTVKCTGGAGTPYTFMALRHPYFTVRGGDVVAGATFDPAGSATPCSAAPNANAGIASWNSDAAPGYAGAGTQYAAMAMSTILGFSSNQGNSNGHGPLSLAFANTSTDLANDVFGGMFGGVPNCIDYWQKMPTGLAAPPNLSSGAGPTDGSFYISQPAGTAYIIQNINLSHGTHRTVYVNGDVEIKNDMKYQPGAWSSQQDIPSLTIIARGRIFIDPAVSQIIGTLIAVPDNPSAVNSFGNPASGTIITCSNGLNALDPANAAELNFLESQCASPLKIYGSFVANQVFLLRTNGSVSTNTPAEQFYYDPATWLASNGSTFAGDGSYKAISGLPPIF